MRFSIFYRNFSFGFVTRTHLITSNYSKTVLTNHLIWFLCYKLGVFYKFGPLTNQIGFYTTFAKGYLHG